MQGLIKVQRIKGKECESIMTGGDQQKGDINTPRKLRSSSHKSDGKMQGQQGQQSQEERVPNKDKEEIDEKIEEDEVMENITLEMIWKTIQGLQNDIKLITKESKEATGISAQISTLESLKQSEINRVNNLEATVKEQDVKIRILTNIVIRQEEALTNVSKILTDIRRQKLRANV